MRLLSCRKIFKYVIVLILFCLHKQNIMAQQDPMFTQYMFNQLSINPAYAGTRDVMSLLLINRNQWVGFDGAPVTSTFSGHLPVYKSMAVGSSVMLDKYGPVNNLSVYVDYAYHLKLNEKTKLSFGLNGGFNYYTINYNELNKTINIDDAYPSDMDKESMPNFGFGMFLYAPHYYVGVSCPRILENNFESISYGDGTEVRHYYAMAGVVFTINDWLILRPSFMSRMAADVPFSFDVNLNALMYNKLWFGIMYRLNDSFGGIVQYQITHQLKFGYAFDFNTSQLRDYNSGSHEVMLNYEFDFKKSRVISPRYF